jgi:hypothetical protein
MSVRFDRRRDENELQRQLRDLICLAVVGDHVRWVLTDHDELGDWLAEAAGQWREWADLVATQLVASGVAPDGRVRSMVRDIPLNWVPEGWLTGAQARRLVAERLALVVERASYRHSQATGSDAELLDLVAAGLETQLRARRKGGNIPAKTRTPEPERAVRAERYAPAGNGTVGR